VKRGKPGENPSPPECFRGDRNWFKPAQRRAVPKWTGQMPNHARNAIILCGEKARQHQSKINAWFRKETSRQLEGWLAKRMNKEQVGKCRSNQMGDLHISPST